MPFGILSAHSNILNGDENVENKKEKRKGRKKGQSTQELMGIQSFTKYGLNTAKGELLFYIVSPTNISVLSQENIMIKIHHLF